MTPDKILESITNNLDKKKVRLSVKPKIEEVDTVGKLCKYLGLSSGDWDGILVTDGSATTYEHTAGWAGILIESKSLQRRVFHGGYSAGTNNVAELMAVVQPLLALSADGVFNKPNGYKLHVVSDSTYVVSGLNDDSYYLRSAPGLRGMWYAVQGCRRLGIVCKGHHIPRDSINLNKLAHAVANISRKSQQNLLNPVYEAIGFDSSSGFPD